MNTLISQSDSYQQPVRCGLFAIIRRLATTHKLCGRAENPIPNGGSD